MPGPLTAAGAVSEPSEYATLSMDRQITGLWTQRNPLRDAAVPYLQSKFYSASRFDSIIDGINREMSSRLTVVRRPGSSVWNANAVPSGNSWYAFKYIQNGTERIQVLYDGKDGVVYDVTAGGKTALFTKSAGAGKTRFIGVGTTLYFTNGVDLKQLVQSAVRYATATAFTANQFIVDTNLNIQQCTVAGTTAGSAPAWATTLGTTTADGSVTWTCKGSFIQNWGIVAPTVSPTVANAAVAPTSPLWAASTFYFQNSLLLDSNGNLQAVLTAGATGTSAPTWNVTAAGTTTDGTVVWVNLGTATRSNTHAYNAAVSTTLTNTITVIGSQAISVASLNGIYVGKVLFVDTGTNLEPVLVTAVNFGSVTFTANFTKTHTSGATVTASADAIAVSYSKTVRVVVDYDPPRVIYGNLTVYFTDFFDCTTAGTSGGSLPGWNQGAGITTNDGTVVWTNLGQQLVWGTPITNPDGTITQASLNPSGVAVNVSNISQILDSNGNQQSVLKAGLSGSVAPTWATNQGGLSTDNKVTWTNAGPAPSSAGTAATYYAFTWRSSVTGNESTASPVSIKITLNGNSSIVIQGPGSADPQVDTVRIYRVAQGKSTLIFVDDVANPGAGVMWNYTDVIPDTALDNLIVAPTADSNDPAPAGTVSPAYHLRRIWAIKDNMVVYSGGPDTLSGNGNVTFPPLNEIPFPEQPIRLKPFTCPNGGLLVFTTTNVYVILGTGVAGNMFYQTMYMEDVGILGYDALCTVGSTFYMLTSKSKFVSLDPSAGYVELGFPIGDQFQKVTTGGSDATTGTLYNPATACVTWHEQSSGDTAIYVSDGAVGWFRLSPVSSPESGHLWSPRAAIVGGTSCVQAVETSPGITQLLIAPAIAGPILFRDLTKNTDMSAGVATPYPSWEIKGNITLCESGEIAEIAHIGLKSTATGSRPIVSLLLGEITATSQVPFDVLSITSTDPPNLPASITLYSDRYSALQNGVCPKCDNFQLKVDYGVQNAPDELLKFSVYGAKHSERKQQ